MSIIKTRGLLLALMLSISLPCLAAESIESLESKQKALNMIADFSEKICNSPVSLVGKSNKLELAGDVKAELKGLAKKIAGLGIKSAAKYIKNEYQGVLQEDIPELLKANSDCKERVSKDLTDKFFSQSIPKKKDIKDSSTQKPERDFKITRLDISVRNSVYYEWDKLPTEETKKHARKTQFSDKKYRQFRYDESYVDDFGKKPIEGVLTALYVMQYAIAKLDLPPDVRDKFAEFILLTPESNAKLKKFLYELVPLQRFIYSEGTGELVPFVQKSEPIHRHFIKSLEYLHDDPKPFQFTYKGKPVKQSEVESLVKEHIAFFTGSYLPVFEVSVENNSLKPITIDKVGAEVINIAEFKGGAEAVPASKILTIPVAYKKGMNERVLSGDEQIFLKSGTAARLLIRLEPQEKLSSYLVRLHVYAGTVHHKTEVFALDM